MKVLFVDVVQDVLKKELKSKGFECIDGENFTIKEIENIIPKVEGIVIRAKIILDQKILKKALKLRFIARSGAGLENIDVDYCNNNGILVFNSPEGNRNAVAEHALGMLLCLFNHLHTSHREILDGKWEREQNRGVELDGKTVGIIGYGNNGSAFAKKLKGFDVEVLVYDKYKIIEQDFQIKCASLNDIFNKADVVSFHIPQNEETLFFANDDFFNSFKKPIYLINCSRGKIVDSKSLLSAIKSKIVLGACLDVLEYEHTSFEQIDFSKSPKPFIELINRKEVLLSPHVAGWTVESYYKLSKILAEKIKETFKK
ncbi:MAG: phosphoglycerate dehydrogenase [Flavobacteriia bacterium]|nr:phosphoglycerate dehydrogenase [Flavobacteriia bacterium]